MISNNSGGETYEVTAVGTVTIPVVSVRVCPPIIVVVDGATKEDVEKNTVPDEYVFPPTTQSVAQRVNEEKSTFVAKAPLF